MKMLLDEFQISNFSPGDKQVARSANRAGATGLSRRNCVQLARSSFGAIWPAGTREALPGSKSCQQKRIAIIAEPLAVRQLAVNFRRVARRHFNRLSQPPHALRFLRSQQMPFSRMMPHHFAGRRNFKSLRRAAVCLQLYLCSWFSRHNIPR
jgi:hypothetical protein